MKRFLALGLLLFLIAPAGAEKVMGRIVTGTAVHEIKDVVARYSKLKGQLRFEFYSRKLTATEKEKAAKGRSSALPQVATLKMTGSFRGSYFRPGGTPNLVFTKTKAPAVGIDRRHKLVIKGGLKSPIELTFKGSSSKCNWNIISSTKLYQTKEDPPGIIGTVGTQTDQVVVSVNFSMDGKGSIMMGVVDNNVHKGHPVTRSMYNQFVSALKQRKPYEYKVRKMTRLSLSNRTGSYKIAIHRREGNHHTYTLSQRDSARLAELLEAAAVRVRWIPKKKS